MRYLRVLKIIIRNAYIRDSKIPGVVTANVLSSLIEITITMTMFSAIFGDIQSLAGWNYYQVVFLYLMMKNISLVNGIVARSGLTAMAKEYVRLGDYDFYLVKPMNTMALVSISKPRVYNFILLVFTIGLSIWAAAKSGSLISIGNIVGFIIMFALSCTLFYFLTVMTIVPSFWFVRLFSLSDLMNRAIQIMRYPAEIYSMPVRVIFFTAFPVLAVTYLPSWTLFNATKLEYIIYMVAITAIFGAIALAVWRAGEWHYGSASS